MSGHNAVNARSLLVTAGLGLVCGCQSACAPNNGEQAAARSPAGASAPDESKMTVPDASAVAIELVLATRRITQGAAIPVEVRLHNASRRRVEVPDFSFDNPDNTWLVFGVGNKTAGAHVGQFHVLDIVTSQGNQIPAELPQSAGEINKTVLKARETLTLSFDLARLLGEPAPGEYVVEVNYESFDGELSHQVEFEIVAQ